MSEAHPPTDLDETPKYGVAVDTALFTVTDTLRVLLIRRGREPFTNEWALPGGFVLPGEDLEAAARRECFEETAISVEDGRFEQLGTYGAPDRDKGHKFRVVSVAYWAILPNLGIPQGGTDAEYAELVPIAEFEGGRIHLAFDHNEILTDAIERARAKIEYTTVATEFCKPEFTLSELRAVYDMVWDTKPPLDAGNFQRKVTHATDRDDRDYVISIGKNSEPGERGGRPAALYRAGPADKIEPPIIRP